MISCDGTKCDRCVAWQIITMRINNVINKTARINNNWNWETEMEVKVKWKKLRKNSTCQWSRQDVSRFAKRLTWVLHEVEICSKSMWYERYFRNECRVSVQPMRFYTICTLFPLRELPSDYRLPSIFRNVWHGWLRMWRTLVFERGFFTHFLCK